MARLAGKVALITGAGTGIGRACAELFAREGARVALAGRRREPLESAARAIKDAGGEALAVPCDVTQAAQVEQALAAHGRKRLRCGVLASRWMWRSSPCFLPRRSLRGSPARQSPWTEG